MSTSQGSTSVSEYYTKLIWEELSSYKLICHVSIENAFVVVLPFLMGLNGSFSHIHGQILLLEPLPSINKMFSLVIQEEKQREVGGFFSSCFCSK